MGVSSFSGRVGCIKIEFWWGGIKYRLGTQTLHQIATVSLRGPGEIYTTRPKAEFTDGMDGWMDGWTGYQKCPSMFLILCGHL